MISKEEKKKRNKELGKRIRNAMREKGLTNEDLMKTLDYLSVQQVRNLLSGQHGLYKSQLEKISVQWNIRMEYLEGKDEFITQSQKDNYDYNEDIKDFEAELRFLRYLGIIVEPVYYWKANIKEIEMFRSNLAHLLDEETNQKAKEIVLSKKGKMMLNLDYMVALSKYSKVLSLQDSSRYKNNHTERNDWNSVHVEKDNENQENNVDPMITVEQTRNLNVYNQEIDSYHYIKLIGNPEQHNLSNLDRLSPKWSQWIYTRMSPPQCNYVVGIGFEMSIEDKKILIEHNEFFKMLSLIEMNAKSLIQFRFEEI